MNEFDIVSKCPTNLTNAVTIWCGQLEDVFTNSVEKWFVSV